MNRTPRLFGSLLGVASGWAVGTAIYHMLLTGSCSTPPGPGEVACPPEMFKYFFYLMGGIFGGVIGTIAGGSWLAFGALFSGIGIGGVAAGLQPAEHGGQKWFLFFGAMFLLTPALGLLSLPFVGLRRLRIQQLMRNGVQGTGTLLDLQDTGVTINMNPRVKMRFLLAPANGMAPYEASKTATVNRLNLPRVGDKYPVWIDPDDPQKFMVATGPQAMQQLQGATSLRKVVEAAKQGARPVPMAPPTDVVQQLNTLNELRLTGKISADEFARRTSDLINAPTS